MIIMYEKMYYILLEAITDSLEMIEWQEFQGALTRLETACLDAEEIFITSHEEEPTEILPTPICCPRWCLQEGETL